MNRAALFVAALCACAQAGTDLPLVTPPVRASVPTGLGGTAVRIAQPGLDASDIASRFFGSAGPTELFAILASIDQRITEVNGLGVSCDAPPVPYTVQAWGETITAYAQCARTDGSGFFQWGTDATGTTWLYTDIGDGRALVALSPIAASADLAVHAWLTVGVQNPTCTSARGSYGVIELTADPATQTFEMSVAGTGLGYCGAELRSTGGNVYVIGSTDMGETCSIPDDACGTAADITAPGTCDPSTTKFLLPALGRDAACDFGDSTYPGGRANRVSVDGSASDTVRSFGPTSPVVAPM